MRWRHAGRPAAVLACGVAPHRSKKPRPIAGLEVADATHNGTAVEATATPLAAAAMQQQGRQEGKEQRKTGLARRDGQCPKDRTKASRVAPRHGAIEATNRGQACGDAEVQDLIHRPIVQELQRPLRPRHHPRRRPPRRLPPRSRCPARRERRPPCRRQRISSRRPQRCRRRRRRQSQTTPVHPMQKGRGAALRGQQPGSGRHVAAMRQWRPQPEEGAGAYPGIGDTAAPGCRPPPQ